MPSHWMNSGPPTNAPDPGLMLHPPWQMMGALEAADGMLLFGISTAFIFTVMQFYYQHLVLRPPATRSKPDKP